MTAVLSARPATGAGGAVPTEGRPAPRRLASWKISALLLAAYLVIALAMLGPGLFAQGGSFPGSGTDPALFMWDLRWMPFALGHHLNPLVTAYIRYPAGANLMWNTSILFPALLMAPVTVLLGPIASYGVLTVIAVTLSAWCGALAVRRYTAGWLPGAVGGLLYGFSPYMISQSLRHPHLYIAVFPPLLLILGDEILVRRRRSPTLLGGLVGVAAACQLLTGEELLALTAVIAGLALAVLALMHRRELRSHLGPAWRAAVPAAVTFVLLCAYPLYVQLLGPQRPTGLSHALYRYTTAPQELVLPSSLQLIGPAGRMGFQDSGAYIGVPLLILCMATVIWLRRRIVVRLAAAMLAIALILSLGPLLHLGGVPLPLPWALFAYLPVIGDAVPIRFMLFAYLAIAVLVGAFLDAGLHREGARWRVGALAAAALALVPLIPPLPFPVSRFPVPAFFTDGSVQRLSRSGSVLMTPYLGVQPLVWQAVSGMAFRTPLGLVFTPSATGPHWGAPWNALGQELQALGDGSRQVPSTIAPALRATYEAELREEGVTSIVAGPSPGQARVVGFVTELVGEPGVSTGGVVVWYSLPGAAAAIMATPQP